MARMDFGDLDFGFSCEINPNEFDQIKEKFFGLYQELYSTRFDHPICQSLCIREWRRELWRIRYPTIPTLGTLDIYIRNFYFLCWFAGRSEEHTSELSHITISYAVFCLKKKKIRKQNKNIPVIPIHNYVLKVLTS